MANNQLAAFPSLAMAKSTTLILVLGAVLISCTPFHTPPFPPLPAGATGSMVTRADAIDDLDSMLRMFEDVHPDLYAEWPRDSAAAARRRLVAALPTTMTRLEWWVRLAPFVASFGDGHTNLAPPLEEVRRLRAGGALTFPPSVALDEDRHLVVTAPRAAGPAVSRGDRIVRINGLSADSLVTEWSKRESGESDEFRSTAVTDLFRDYLQIDGIAAPFALRVASQAGAERDVIVAGMSLDSLMAILLRGRSNAAAPNARTMGAANGSASPSGLQGPGYTYRLVDRGVGYVDFRSMLVDLGAFRRDIAATFRRVADDSDRVLIVDLRTNGGGDSRVGDEFLRYVTAKPYRMSARKDWKMSAEYRAFLGSGVSAPIMALHLWALHPIGRSMFAGAPGKIVTIPEEPKAHARAEPFFDGAVCVLIGPRSFSSASDFADAVKTYRLATLIGEETGGRPNTFGDALFFRLPHSSLSMSVSSARFVRANGDTADHRGVIPDVIVTPSTADRKAGRDAVLERAKGCERM